MLEDKEKETTEQLESKEEQDGPLIKPGFDYIWGSDQDDLVEDKED